MGVLGDHYPVNNRSMNDQLQAVAVTGYPAKIPIPIIAAVGGICVLPYLLMLTGVDFGSDPRPFDVSATADSTPGEVTDVMFYSLSGAFTHTLLEWSAVCAAIFTVWLAFCHYKLVDDITTPIIAVALFFSGVMDAFHAIAADRLMDSVADPANLEPFTWAVCRLFHALIMIAGVGIFLIRGIERYKITPRDVVSISLCLGVLAYSIIYYCAVSETLPQTQFPDAVITRPYDVIPLLVYLFAGLYLYPHFYNKVPSLFAHALIISAFVEVAVEIHMAFGSSQLFDSHFNVAHFLKIIAYCVLLLGLTLDYVDTYRKRIALTQANVSLSTELYDHKQAEEAIRNANSKLRRQTKELAQANEELSQFTYAVSHDLKTPLRAINGYSNWLAKDLADTLDEEHQEYIDGMQEAVGQAERLIDDLLELSRIGRRQAAVERIALTKFFHGLVTTLKLDSDVEMVIADHLPTIEISPTLLTQIFQNLIINAVIYNQSQPKRVKIACRTENSAYEISVSDNGIGIDPEFHKRIFQIFQRLHTREEFEGTGVGLAIVKKAAQQVNGGVRVESELGRGSTFWVTLPQGETTS
ncbi:MAG: sensor histidine kinase [Pseudomonadales bacterium]